MAQSPLHAAVQAVALAFRGKPDSALDSPWAWGPHDEEGVRFGILRTAEELRSLAARTVTDRIDAGDPPSEAQRILSEHHRGFRQLEAILARVDDDLAGMPPAEGEWSVRETLAHMARTETGFHVAVTHGLACARNGEPPTQIPDEAWDEIIGLPYPELEAILGGEFSGVWVYFGRAEVRTMEDFASVSGQELDARSHFWEPDPMPIRHRLFRFDSHLRQHTVQIEKTLEALGRGPTEGDRLMRLVYDALGEAEAAELGGVAIDAYDSTQLAGNIDARAAELAEAMARKMDEVS